MAKLTVETVKEYGLLPVDTIIGVEVEDITEKMVPGKDGKEGWEKLEFKFVIRELPDYISNDPEYAELLGSRIWGSVGMKLTEHVDNKLRQWAEALLNMGTLGAGFELDTDMLLGRSCRAYVGQYVKKDGTAKHQVASLAAAAPLATAPAVILEEAQPALVGAGAADPWDNDEPPF